MGNYRNFKLVVYFVAAGTASETRDRLEKELDFFGRHMRLDKVYLEPYRSGEFAGEGQTLLCKDVFEKRGIEVAGGITTTIPTPEGEKPKQRMFDTFCYNDEKMIGQLVKVSEFLGKHFDEFIIDDFFFTNCTCDACRRGRDAYNEAHGILDGSWQEYRLDLMRRVSEDYMIAPARKQNKNVKITIKYPNWSESFQETGYNPREQRELYDNIYTGTETRDPVSTDQHLPRYLSFSLMTYFENMWRGHNGGGWFDPFDMHVTEHYLEQAYLTAFSKPKEMMMFCFQALVDNMNVPALGFQLDKLDRVLDFAGSPIGIECYLPDNSQGEDNIQDFLGMNGLPVVETPYFPEKAQFILLTQASAYDKDVVDKLDRYVSGGGKALVTNGFLAATMDRGIKRMTSVRLRGRRVTVSDYRIEKKYRERYSNNYLFPHAPKPYAMPVCEFRNNAAWALVKGAVGQESYAILLRETYGLGQLLTFVAPDAFSQTYNLPVEALTRIRAEFPVGDVYLEGGDRISLFVYDNDSFILYPYVDDGVQATEIRLHVLGRVKALRLPVQGRELAPLYQDEHETVFRADAIPGKYVICQIVR